MVNFHLNSVFMGALDLTVFYLLAWHHPIQAEPILQEQLNEAKAFFDSPYTEEDYYRTDEQLITATGSLKPVFKAPSVASVITKEEIEAMGAMTLDQILETVPGLHVQPDGVNVFSSFWVVRGIKSSLNPHVLLLINGVPLTYTLQGARFQSYRMPVAMISRVEIVRGPGSAIHGADAFSGTINVITKDGQEINGTQTGLRYGSFDTIASWAQHGGQYNGWDVAASVETQKTDGDDNRIIDQDALGSGLPSLTPGPLDTKYDLIETHLALRKNHWNLRFYGNWFDHNGLGAGGAQVLNEGSYIDGGAFSGDIVYQTEEWAKNWDIQLRANTVYYSGEVWFQFFPTDYRNAIGNPSTNEFTHTLDITAFYNGFSQHNIRLNAGYKSYDIETDHNKNFGVGITEQFGPLVNLKGSPFIFMEDQQRHLNYFSLQDEWSFAKRWELTAGVRYDHYDDFGATINPRVALVWETRPDLTSKLLYGHAFRAPSFGEQHFQNNPVTLGNEDLNPETIRTLELAFDYQPTNRLRTLLNLFIHDIEGLIEYVPDPAPATTRTAQNLSNQEGYGFEAEMDWEITDQLQLRANMAYQRSKNKETDALVADAPAWEFYLNPHWQFAPGWSLDGQYFWIGDRQRATGDNRPAIEDYQLINLTLRRKGIAKRWDVALAVRNLLDEDIREPSPNPGLIPNDYPMESRAFYGEVRLQF